MTKGFTAAFTAIVLAGLIAACTDSGGDAGAKSAQQIVGEWKSESITRQGTVTAKFSGDGACYLRESGGEKLSCRWTAPRDGQPKIAINFPGRSDTSFASVIGNRLSIHEPARETFFVREESQLLGSLRLLLPDKATQ